VPVTKVQKIFHDYEQNKSIPGWNLLATWGAHEGVQDRYNGGTVHITDIAFFDQNGHSFDYDQYKAGRSAVNVEFLLHVDPTTPTLVTGGLQHFIDYGQSWVYEQQNGQKIHIDKSNSLIYGWLRRD